MAEERLTELQAAILEIEALGLPRRDAMRLVTQRVGYFVGQARYAQELAKARKLLTSLPPDVAGGGEDALVRSLEQRPRIPRSATHQIGSTGG